MPLDHLAVRPTTRHGGGNASENGALKEIGDATKATSMPCTNTYSWSTGMHQGQPLHCFFIEGNRHFTSNVCPDLDVPPALQRCACRAAIPPINGSMFCRPSHMARDATLKNFGQEHPFGNSEWDRQCIKTPTL